MAYTLPSILKALSQNKTFKGLKQSYEDLGIKKEERQNKTFKGLKRIRVPAISGGHERQNKTFKGLKHGIRKWRAAREIIVKIRPLRD